MDGKAWVLIDDPGCDGRGNPVKVFLSKERAEAQVADDAGKYNTHLEEVDLDSAEALS